MAQLILTTYDWVPEPPRGLVRDLRIRWALEEGGLPYRVETTPFHNREPAHRARQPFAQVPWLTDGDQTVFESGAILLHLGERSDALMPSNPQGRSQVIQWLFAALNSVEVVTMPWGMLRFAPDGPDWKFWDDFFHLRLKQLESILAKHEWLAGGFSIADIMMADVLRFPDRFDGLAGYPECRAYVARATARPAFAKAYDDQMTHFAGAD